MHHAPLGMPALAREVVPERRGVARELRSQLDQFPHAPRSFSDGDAHRFLAAQSRAGHERVVDVLLVAVLWAEDGRNPSLGICGVALRPASLGEQGNGPVPGRLYSEGKPSNSRAEHEVVELVAHVGRLSESGRVKICPPGWRGVIVPL